MRYLLALAVIVIAWNIIHGQILKDRKEQWDHDILVASLHRR